MDNTSNLLSKPPVVVVTGHIDHGKTTLLSYIRQNKSILNESGNITQHISAYEIEMESEGKKRKITFLDTPGHEAFSSLRSRGAKIADIAILIIAANEGVKPQTKEALSHILNNEVPFIVAINKIDLPNANVDKIKNELAQMDVYLEGRGGEVPCIEISAKDGTNVDELLEMILLLSDLKGDMGDTSKPASGFIIESNMDSRRGFTAYGIIKDGTLNLNDSIYTYNTSGKIKILEDFTGKAIQKISFSSPCTIVGFDTLPEPGSIFIAGDVSEKEIEELKEATNEFNLCKNTVIGEETNMEAIKLVIKSDCIGSCEALIESLKTLASENDFSFRIIDNNIGNINEKDIKSADSSKASIINFRVKMDADIKNFLESKNIKVFYGDTIYQILEQIKNYYTKDITSGPTVKAQLRVLAVFNPSRSFQVVGGELFEGQIELNNEFQIVRNESDLGNGILNNIQCQKQNATHLGAVNECGLMLTSDIEIQKDDVLVFYEKNI